MRNRPAQKMEETTFPLEYKIQFGSSAKTHKLSRYDVVRCLFCGSSIILSNHTVKMMGGMDYVMCGECRRGVSVLYYFDRKIGHVAWGDEDEVRSEEASRDST